MISKVFSCNINRGSPVSRAFKLLYRAALPIFKHFLPEVTKIRPSFILSGRFGQGVSLRTGLTRWALLSTHQYSPGHFRGRIRNFYQVIYCRNVSFMKVGTDFLKHDYVLSVESNLTWSPKSAERMKNVITTLLDMTREFRLVPHLGVSSRPSAYGFEGFLLKRLCLYQLMWGFHVSVHPLAG